MRMTSKLNELDRLASLRDRGVVSESEFTQAKAEILSGPTSADMETGAAFDKPAKLTADEKNEANTDFPLWAVLRPMETADQARSLLHAGYYAATAICVQGTIFLSRYPVVSDEDNVVLIVCLAILAAVTFLAARSISKKASGGAAWLLLIIACCQAFGTLTEGRWDWGMIALGTAGVLISVQAIRATSAVRRLTPNSDPSEHQPDISDM